MQPLPNLQRPPGRVVNVIVSAILSLWTTVACAQQDAAIRLAPSPQDSAAELTEMPVPTGETGFWFVSTHYSPQSFDRSPPRFCPRVARHEQCTGYHPASFQDLVASLQPGIPVCIMVHGSFVDVPSAFRESACTWKWLQSASRGLPMQMIYFNWPSYKGFTPAIQIDANLLGRRAARNGYYLAEMIQHIPPECPICLIGHSHGTRLISAGLHLLAGGRIQGVGHPFARVNGRHIRTVFTVAAMDHDWLNPGHRYDRALCSTQCLLNMKNGHDPALLIYPMRLPLIAKRALGNIGLTRGDRRRLGSRGSKILDYDVTRAIGASHLWPYFYNNPHLAMAMHNYVYFPDRAVTGVANAPVRLEVR